MVIVSGICSRLFQAQHGTVDVLIPMHSDCVRLLLLDCFRLKNCRRAMELAKQHFDIPLVLRPEDLCSPQLDEKSAILYLSYFTRVGGPGYNATMERVQKRLTATRISNFTVSCRSFFLYGVRMPLPVRQFSC